MLTQYGEHNIAQKFFVLQEEAHLHSAAATYCSSNQAAEDWSPPLPPPHTHQLYNWT